MKPLIPFTLSFGQGPAWVFFASKTSKAIHKHQALEECGSFPNIRNEKLIIAYQMRRPSQPSNAHDGPFKCSRTSCSSSANLKASLKLPCTKKEHESPRSRHLFENPLATPVPCCRQSLQEAPHGVMKKRGFSAVSLGGVRRPGHVAFRQKQSKPEKTESIWPMTPMSQAGSAERCYTLLRGKVPESVRGGFSVFRDNL